MFPIPSHQGRKLYSILKGRGHGSEYLLNNKPIPFIPQAQSSPLDTRLVTHYLCIHPEKFYANISILTNKYFNAMASFYTHSSIPWPLLPLKDISQGVLHVSTQGCLVSLNTTLYCYIKRIHNNLFNKCSIVGHLVVSAVLSF